MWGRGEALVGLARVVVVVVLRRGVHDAVRVFRGAETVHGGAPGVTAVRPPRDGLAALLGVGVLLAVGGAFGWLWAHGLDELAGHHDAAGVLVGVVRVGGRGSVVGEGWDWGRKGGEVVHCGEDGD